MSEVEQLTFEFAQRPTIKGFPELRWTGKRPYKSTQYYPAQLRETYGEEQNGWMNKIFWGDNLQVMSHLLKEYRGQIQLIYIHKKSSSRKNVRKPLRERYCLAATVLCCPLFMVVTILKMMLGTIPR